MQVGRDSSKYFDLKAKDFVKDYEYKAFRDFMFKNSKEEIYKTILSLDSQLKTTRSKEEFTEMILNKPLVTLPTIIIAINGYKHNAGKYTTNLINNILKFQETLSMFNNSKSLGEITLYQDDKAKPQNFLKWAYNYDVIDLNLK